MKTPSIERIRELLSYCPETGVFRWIKSKGHVKGGSVAGTKSSNGYLKIGIDDCRCYSHRLAWAYVHGEWPEDEIDHINWLRDDNRIANLRKATRIENQQNNRDHSKNSSSGLLGVVWIEKKKKWRAAISHKNRHCFIGHFDCKHAAHEAYMAKKRELHPFSEIAKSKGSQC